MLCYQPCINPSIAFRRLYTIRFICQLVLQPKCVNRTNLWFLFFLFFSSLGFWLMYKIRRCGPVGPNTCSGTVRCVGRFHPRNCPSTSWPGQAMLWLTQRSATDGQGIYFLTVVGATMIGACGVTSISIDISICIQDMKLSIHVFTHIVFYIDHEVGVWWHFVRTPIVCHLVYGY